MAQIRLAGVQMDVAPKLSDNLPKILEHIKETSADYILFPEMSLTGYHGDFSDKNTRAAWDKVAAACRQSYTTALIGTGAKIDGETFIQTRIYDPEGELLGTHEKLVPTAGDRKFCTPGGELRTFKHNGLTFGCLICNDLWVTPGCGPYPDPRLSYQLGQKGVDIIFQSAHTGPGERYRPYHESNLVLRAMESKVHIVVVNAASMTRDTNCPSGVISPEGKWLTQAPLRGESLFGYDLELDIEKDEEEPGPGAAAV